MPLRNTLAHLCAAITAACALSTAHAQALVPDGLDPGEPAAVRRQMQFGASVSASGSGVLVGAPGTDGHGSAYLFMKRENDPKWYLMQKFVAPDIAPGTFGSLVVFDGSVLIADQKRHLVYYFQGDAIKFRPKAILRGGVTNFGAAIASAQCVVLITSTGDPAIRQPGFVHIFDRCTPNEPIKYKGSFSPPRISADEQFGASIAIDTAEGNRILVGAPGADHGFGAVYAYSYDFERDVWVLKQRMVQPNRLPGDVGFGSSVSLRNRVGVVGAPLARPNPPTGTSGLAFLLNRQNDDTWAVGAPFRPEDPVGWARFGHKVYTDFNTVTVSAPGSSSPVATGGNLYVYYTFRFPFAPTMHLTGHQRDSRFGSDFGIGLDYFHVGEPFYRTAPTTNEGAAARYLYPW